MTSEEDEITKKEREIIEILEKEEQWRYGTQQNHIGLYGFIYSHTIDILKRFNLQTR